MSWLAVVSMQHRLGKVDGKVGGQRGLGRFFLGTSGSVRGGGWGDLNRLADFWRTIGASGGCGFLGVISWGLLRGACFLGFVFLAYFLSSVLHLTWLDEEHELFPSVLLLILLFDYFQWHHGSVGRTFS